MKRLQLFLFLSLLSLVGYAQPNAIDAKKPKVALVLSGGGAKGLAHIPTLQLLDSLGIVPDLVVGTSMGSIVGGLYSMGYSGDSIAQISRGINWSKLFKNDIPWHYISMEEKSEYKRYLVDLDWVKGRPVLKSALINDQKLRELIGLLTYPAFEVNDFDKLPIPFRAVTTDIVNGKEIVIKEGALGNALRASMSIPTVFSPVPYENTLLVDGGVLNNFPVDIAKSMGADIIIGSDVGGGMLPKEKLDDMTNLIFQTGMINSNLKNPANRKLCDVLIDHVPHLTYENSDFTSSDEIYAQGIPAANAMRPQLAQLAQNLKGYRQREVTLPVNRDSLVLDTVIFKNISKTNLELVKARVGVSSGDKVSLEDMVESMEKTIGTNLFNQITAEPYIKNDTGYGLIVNVYEKSPHQIKSALHYDNYRGIGLILNYTGRNVLGHSSRLLGTLDIAEQPSIRLQYQKIFGKNKKWWTRAELFNRSLEQNIYRDGALIKGMDYDFFQMFDEINFSLNPYSSYFGLGINFEKNGFTNPDVGDPNNFLDFERYRSENLELYSHVQFNTLDHVFFAKKGGFAHVTLARSIFNDVEVNLIEDPNDDITGNVPDFTRISLDAEYRFPWSDKVTTIIGAQAGLVFLDNSEVTHVDFQEYGQFARYPLGGLMTNTNRKGFTFPGLQEGELNASQLVGLQLGVQFNLFENLYFTPHYNLASVGFGDFEAFKEDLFNPKGNWKDTLDTSDIQSFGLTGSYDSILGPITLDVTWTNHLVAEFYLGIGLQLNRSN
jgi:NTE family protein